MSKENTPLDIIHKDEFFFHQKKTDSGDMPVWVQRVAREHWGQNFFLSRRVSDKIFIAFIQKGFIKYGRKKGVDQITGPGSVLFLSPLHTLNIETIKPEGAQILVSIFTGKKGHSFAQQYLGNRSSAISLTDPSRVESLFYRILETGEKGGLNATEIASSLIHPLLLTIDQEHKTHTSASNQAFAIFSKCRIYIENNWKIIKSVKDIPALFDISQPYMNTLFQRYEGCSPHNFLLQRKMAYALYQLQQGNQKVSHLANELGFADAFSFSKTFKRIIGTSPSKMKA